MIIFWIIQKPYHVHITCWNVSGRKLPTAYTSQQLLGGWGQRRYIFPFFLHTKNTEKYGYINPHTSHVDTRFHVRNLCPKCPKSWTFWDLKSRVLRCPKSYFSDISGKVRKSGNLRKSWILPKIGKIAKIRKISKKSTFWHFEGYPTQTAKILSGSKNLENLDFSGKVRFPEFCVPTRFFAISGSRKKVRKFRNFRPSKNRKKVSNYRGKRRSQMAVVLHFRRQKKCHFSRFFEGKGKKCTFFGNFDGFCD